MCIHFLFIARKKGKKNYKNSLLAVRDWSLFRGSRGAANRERVNDWEKKGGGRCMHITLSNIRAMEGTKGGWFVVPIIFYKQSYQRRRT